MTSANVGLLRSLFAAWERGDYSSLSWADPEIEFSVVDGPIPGTWTGIAGMTAGYREVMNAWSGYAGELEGYRELEDGRLLAMIRLSGLGKTSGLELGHVQPRAAGVFEIKNGRVIKLALYWDRQQAFADLGLASDANFESP